MSVDRGKRKGGLASRKVSPWGKFRIDTPRGLASAKRYHENARAADANGATQCEAKDHQRQD